jgi:hypothetical protein
MKTCCTSFAKFHLGLCIVLACAVGWLTGSFTGPLRAEDNSIEWLGSYGEALRQAKQTQKPILVEFRCEA